MIKENCFLLKHIRRMSANAADWECDVIKQNQSEDGNIDFKIELNKAENVFCFLLFLASFNFSYLWNQLTNLYGGSCKM